MKTFRNSLTMGVEFACETATLLIIDDEPAITRTVAAYLKRDGFDSVHSLNDPRLAISTIKRLQPDLVLLDITMPHLNGLEILRQILDDESLSDTIVLILSAATKADKYKAINLGAFGFVDKPVVQEKIVSSVRSALRAL